MAFKTVAGDLSDGGADLRTNFAGQVDDDGSGDGGGLLKEVGAVLDPTRRASTQTEQAIGVAGKAAYILTSPAAAGAMAGSTGDPTGTSDELVGRQFDREQGGGYGDVIIEEAGDAAPDLPEPPDLTPRWFDWILNNQEAVAVLLVVLAFAYATDGTVGVGGGN